MEAIRKEIRTEIEQKLAESEKKENVTVLYAVESGSRAWGVESPDSDYDVRFVYMRPKEDYLKLEGMRDVIDWQLDDILDINGWDLRKTLIQFHKGNATLFEWCNSPVVYKTTVKWKLIHNTAVGYFSEKAALHHYYGTAQSTYCRYLQQEKVSYKKYIYALRPLLACKYIEDNHCVPPVLFSDLLKQDLPGDLQLEVEQLLRVKRQTDEKVPNEHMPVIQNYLAREISRLEVSAKERQDDRNKDWDALNKIFVDLL